MRLHDLIHHKRQNYHSQHRRSLEALESENSGKVFETVKGYDVDVSGKLGEKYMRRHSNTNSDKQMKGTLGSFRKK
jgi:hypothetical protein